MLLEHVMIAFHECSESNFRKYNSDVKMKFFKIELTVIELIF